MKPVVIGVPKGRLRSATDDIISSILPSVEGEFFNPASRRLHFSAEQGKLLLVRAKSADVMKLVSLGIAQIGLVGSDTIFEVGSKDIVAPFDFCVGRCQLVIAGPRTPAPPLQPRVWSIGTSYPRLVGRFAKSSGRAIRVADFRGSIEMLPKLGLADFIVDLYETGQTLRENDLTLKTAVSDISLHLILSRDTYANMESQVKAALHRLSSFASAKARNPIFEDIILDFDALKST